MSELPKYGTAGNTVFTNNTIEFSGVADELDRDTDEFMAAVQQYQSNPGAEQYCQSLIDKIQPTIRRLPITGKAEDSHTRRQRAIVERFFYWHEQYLTVWADRNRAVPDDVKRRLGAAALSHLST